MIAVEKLQGWLEGINRTRNVFWFFVPIAVVAVYFTPSEHPLFPLVATVSGVIIVFMILLLLSSLFLLSVIAFRKQELFVPGELGSDTETYRGNTARILGIIGACGAVTGLLLLVFVIVVILSG